MQTYLNEFFIIAIAHFIALLSPGADFAYLVSSSLSNTKKVAIGTSLGIALSNGFYILLCLFGYATIFSHSLYLMIFIKIAGGAYLIYLGFGIVKSKNMTLRIGKATKSTFLKEVIKGFYLSFLNPKISIFYISLFALVIDKNTPFFVQILYGVWMFVFVFMWDSSLVILINKKSFKEKILSMPKISTMIGLFLIFMGIMLFFSLTS